MKIIFILVMSIFSAYVVRHIIEVKNKILQEEQKFIKDENNDDANLSDYPC